MEKIISLLENERKRKSASRASQAQALMQLLAGVEQARRWLAEDDAALAETDRAIETLRAVNT